MNKFKSKNKICFQNYNNKHAYLKIKKLKRKKWINFFKKINFKREEKLKKKIFFFKKRLFEKQQLKNFYGCLNEYKLKFLIKKKNFLSLIESRLDINILRLKFAKTFFQAKQLINHKKIKINNKIINKSNFILKKGDIILINKKNEKKNSK
jgi:ribosomal protein S4